MVCKKCGVQNEEQAAFCVGCGEALNQVSEAAAPAAIPAEYRPLSPWAYFGLTLLFSVPIVGFVFLIIYSIKRDNINRRNFARSYWCSLIVVGAAVALFTILLAAVGFTFADLFAEMMYY